MKILSGIGFLVKMVVVSALIGFVLGLYMAERARAASDGHREPAPQVTTDQQRSSSLGSLTPSTRAQDRM